MRDIASQLLFATVFLSSSILYGASTFPTDDASIEYYPTLETHTLPPNPPHWARDPQGFVVSSEADDSLEGQSTTRITHQSSTDWALSMGERVTVEPGELFELTCKIKNVGPSNCETSVVIYDAEGTAQNWSYGSTTIPASANWQTISAKILVPEGASQIEARVIGNGLSDARVASYTLTRLGKIKRSPIKGTLPAENRYLRLVFNMEDATFSIRDVRTNRVWNQTLAGQTQFVAGAQPIPRGMLFKLLDGRSLFSYTATVQLEPNAPEVVVKLSAPGDAPFSGVIDYPHPFTSKSSDRIILPVNEGISFPATESAYGVRRMHTYGGHGLCMAFWGIVDDNIDAAHSSGLMGIIETPDDAEVETALREVDRSDAEAFSNGVQTLAIGNSWFGTKQKFGYDRVLRLVAFNKGGYVAICKRYREYAKKIGLLLTFKDKITQNPSLSKGIDRLLGAANIWCWNSSGDVIVPQLQDLGFNHILWSGGGSSKVISDLNSQPGVLTSRYDIYQDIMDPSRYNDISYVDGNWVSDAWPQDIVWDSPSGDWRKGWSVDAKDPTQPRVYCATLCDVQAEPYALKRISEDLQKTPYLARFIDTTVASPWCECWNPAHPMTRTDSKKARMRLLGLIGQHFNLVCGSETGIDASVPYCDFYEGMMSLGPYRCPESGRYLDRIWTEVPPEVEKYQFGEGYRLPLFELVYHDCVVSYWYWGDHNNKFPSLWHKRDLFNALYGVPPMYGFTREFFEENRERFAESYRVAEPVSRLTGGVEMTNHEILTSDRTVQKTSFANGVESIVNFGDKEYRCPDGVVVAPGASRILEGGRR